MTDQSKIEVRRWRARAETDMFLDGINVYLRQRLDTQQVRTIRWDATEDVETLPEGAMSSLGPSLHLDRDQAVALLEALLDHLGTDTVSLHRQICDVRQEVLDLRCDVLDILRPIFRVAPAVAVTPPSEGTKP